MDIGLNPEELSTDLLFVVCARCGEERPESAFRAKRQSAGQTKQCIDCRNQRVSHVPQGGKDSQDDSLKAGARAKLAVIQRDHRSRRRAGETVSLTPTISQLGFLEDFEGPGEDGSQDQLRPSGFLDGDGIIKEGDDRGQFSESDIDADDYFNLLLSPARPRRYLKQLGVESDSDLGDEDENDDNDCVDGSPLRHRLRQPSAQLRRGRRGPAPGTGGRPRKSRRQTRSSMPPRRIRSPVIIPPEESAVFHAQDPVWNGDLEACALTGRDKAILRDQEAFRTALGELRLLQLSMESWKLLSTRVQAKLDDREVARFSSALRVYATKDRVNEYNHYHLDRLGRPVVQVKAKNVGPGAAAAPDDKAGNLAKQIPICIGARLMLTSNLWQPVGLCNGARGTVYDIGWAPGADPIQDPPCVIMMEFDKYNGPVFLTTPDGKKIVPILPVERDFLIGATLCARTQFPLIVCYAITVHKSQSITEDMIVTDLSCRDFQTGLSYVAVSRVKTLEGLMLDAPFDRNHLVYGSPPDGMKMKMRDQELRKRQVLTRSPYMIYNTKNGHGTGSVRR
ncbi:hypothetical protein FOMA001_g3573 [Fusarium oxysporum f. sp. matthiolae]|nr:hypothetical protein FOMA001_g18937 [Fusarium oxysporum f. sp. matthiolae]KAH7462789.1 hypothetical protein FOMA001_g18338 [Fusarium oxysporum f. sp. matthiolae]KAH7464436.1 hypothetical protein FOMA001_g17472 [Fusarium oxysporum f. sp. matthiolae]KAH7466045.1 hypothetical protein FOMA001_g15974 [Fusarium oxysporum f. sp. matthiolae]KAH7468299.1 hypothetical protein FOMA001_g15692 [Fusarium oxysporum f. sp. matthiolae]